jgi:hypothetical protein
MPNSISDEIKARAKAEGFALERNLAKPIFAAV